ncbi:MAG TPA: hypothetical protein VFK23_04250 [Nitrospirota bacterium]|nr:hypothetical protein [Nitrospirota bacterium]
MVVDLEKKEVDLLVNELEHATIPNLREFIASGLREEHREELKQDEVVLKHLLEKLKMAA